MCDPLIVIHDVSSGEKQQEYYCDKEEFKRIFCQMLSDLLDRGEIDAELFERGISLVSNESDKWWV